MDIKLIFPPFATTLNTPPVGLSALYPFLRNHGYESSVIDLNIEFFEYLLVHWHEVKPILLEKIVRLRKEEKWDAILRNRKLLEITLPLMENVYQLFSRQSCQTPCPVSRSPRFLHKCMRDLINIYLFGNLFINGDYLRTNINQMAEAIGPCLKDELFLSFVSQYKWHDTDLVGFSLLAETQLPFAMLLSMLLKERFPTVKLAAGGAYITEIADKAASERNIFQYFDFLVVHEGETALLEIIKAIEKPQSIVHPNIFSLDHRDIRSAFVIEEIETLPEQDFSCFQLDLYRRWGLHLPVYSSKGCTWGRCAFCNIHFLKYRERNIELFIDSVLRMKSMYGVDHIQLVDEDVRPERLSMMADFLLRNDKIKVHWMIQTRFYKELDESLLQKIKRAGFETIEFGLESANSDTLLKIRKGISLKQVHQILSDCEKVGIKVIVNFMVGFPWESEPEAEVSLSFVDDIRSRYPSLRLTCNTQKVKIYVNSDFHQNPERYAIHSYERLPLSTILSWEPPEWVSSFIQKHKEHLLFAMDDTNLYNANRRFTDLTDNPFLTIGPSWYHLSAHDPRYKALGLERCLLVHAINTSWEAIHINDTMDSVLSELTRPCRLDEMKQRFLTRVAQFERSSSIQVFGDALVQLNEMGVLVFYEN